MGDTKTPDATPADAKDAAPEAELNTDGESHEDTAATPVDAEASQPTLAELQSELRKKGAAEKSLRDRLRKLEKEDADRKAAEMTEADKLRADRETFDKERATFTQSQRDFTARTQVIEEARKAGFKVSPERVFALVKGEIVFDDDGSPTNVGDVVAALAKDEPGMVGAANGSPTNPDRSRGQGLTAADLKKMTPQQVAALDPKVLEAL